MREAGRALALLAAAGLPLLLVVVALVGHSGIAATLAAVLLWAAGIAALALYTWRRLLLPTADAARELGAETSAGLDLRARELKARLEAAEERAAALASLLQDLSGSLGEGLLVLGPDLTLRLANPAALQLFDRERIDEGSHLLDLVRSPEVVDAAHHAATGGTPPRVYVENPHGQWEVRAYPIRGGGAVVQLSEVGLLRRAAELRRRFAQDLSHELRAPLTVLRTTVEALEGEVPAQLAAVLVRQVERIARLTDELYELASIESGEVELTPEPQLLAPLVSELLRDFASAAEAAGVELRAAVPPDFTLVCDRRALLRVLGNLIDNGIKYNRRGGWVEVAASRTAAGVSLRVADSGVGIPASELGAVLQRFYRIDRARTPGEGGLGLGLAIVKHMVALMGGTLHLDSREAVGTHVTVTFPATEPTA